MPTPIQVASNLLQMCGINDPANLDLKDLISYHDGIVQEVDLKNCDGRTVMKNGKAIVSLNAKIEFPQKKRFVLAHELGHILLHREKEAMFSDDYSTIEAYKHGPQEKEANDFATELLMPPALFKEACFKKKFGSDLLRNLAERFNTSITSTVYRYVELGNHPICVFFSKDGKIQYWKKSNDFWLRIPESTKLNVPPDSVANEYYTKGRIYTQNQSDQTIFKSTWFELGDDDIDTQMFEYCIVTKHYNTVLSVIWQK